MCERSTFWFFKNIFQKLKGYRQYLFCFNLSPPPYTHTHTHATNTTTTPFFLSYKRYFQISNLILKKYFHNLLGFCAALILFVRSVPVIFAPIWFQLRNRPRSQIESRCLINRHCFVFSLLKCIKIFGKHS